jgi:hypothetical protein
MATVTHITSTTTDYVCDAPSLGIYSANRLFVLRSVRADVRCVFGDGSQVLRQTNGKPVDGRTHGITTDTFEDGDTTIITVGISGKNINTVWVSDTQVQTCYDRRIVTKACDAVMAEVGIALSKMSGVGTSITNLTYDVTLTTIDESSAVLVFALTEVHNESRR